MSLYRLLKIWKGIERKALRCLIENGLTDVEDMCP